MFKIWPILTHSRNIIMNQYKDKFEYIIPINEPLLNRLYTVKIENNLLKIVFLRLKK